MGFDRKKTRKIVKKNLLCTHTTTSNKNPQMKYLRFSLLPYLTSHSCEINNKFIYIKAIEGRNLPHPK